MFRAISTAFVLGCLALGIWAGSDLWTATSEVTAETIGEQDKVVFYLPGMV